jgi:hypothetical protein
MAWENPHEVLEGALAGQDLTAAQDSFVLVDSSGNIILNATAGGAVDGVLLGKPNVGQPASVALGGRCIVKCGAGVNPGDLVASDDQGRAVTAAGGTFAAGRALSGTTTAGERLTIALKPYGFLPVVP